jgi:hypothetical protein
LFSSPRPAQQASDPAALACLAVVNVRQRFRQQLVEPGPQSDQIAILRQATPQERERYWPYASIKTRAQWSREMPQQPIRLIQQVAQ